MSSRCQRHSRLPLTCCPHYAHSYWQGKWRMKSQIITGETQDWVFRFRVSDQPLANEQPIAAQYSCHVICSTQSEKSVAPSHTRDVRLCPGTRRGRRPTCYYHFNWSGIDAFWRPTIFYPSLGNFEVLISRRNYKGEKVMVMMVKSVY